MREKLLSPKCKNLLRVLLLVEKLLSTKREKLLWPKREKLLKAQSMWEKALT